MFQIGFGDYVCGGGFVFERDGGEQDYFGVLLVFQLVDVGGVIDDLEIDVIYGFVFVEYDWCGEGCFGVG